MNNMCYNYSSSNHIKSSGNASRASRYPFSTDVRGIDTMTYSTLSPQEPQTAEQWREIPGSEGRYEVSDHGRVRSYRYHRQWHAEPRYHQSYVSKIGYVYYHLSLDGKTKNYAAHRLVLLAFVGPSELGVNHKDGNKKNNSLDNLEYMTHRENVRHSFRVLDRKAGRPPTFETEQDAEIRALIASGMSQRQVAQRYGVSQPYISYIASMKIRPPRE